MTANQMRTVSRQIDNFEKKLTEMLGFPVELEVKRKADKKEHLQLIEIVCSIFDLNRDKLLHWRTRKGEYTDARKIITVILMDAFGYTNKQVRDVFQWHQASVIDAYNKGKDWIENDDSFRAKYNKVGEAMQTIGLMNGNH